MSAEESAEEAGGGARWHCHPCVGEGRSSDAKPHAYPLALGMHPYPRVRLLSASTRYG